MPRSRIVINVKGGLVQEVVTSDEVDVVIFDEDIEGNYEHVQTFEYEGLTTKAAIYHFQEYINPAHVDAVFNAAGIPETELPPGFRGGVSV